jgi:hypothetical protein
MNSEKSRFDFLGDAHFDTISQILADLYLSYQDNNECKIEIKENIHDLALFFRKNHPRMNSDVIAVVNWLCFNGDRLASIPSYFVERMREVGIALTEEKFFRFN